jgi:hypothetical protein
MCKSTRRTGTRNYKNKKRESDGFSHENLNPVLRVWEVRWN